MAEALCSSGSDRQLIKKCQTNETNGKRKESTALTAGGARTSRRWGCSSWAAPAARPARRGGRGGAAAAGGTGRPRRCPACPTPPTPSGGGTQS